MRINEELVRDILRCIDRLQSPNGYFSATPSTFLVEPELKKYVCTNDELCRCLKYCRDQQYLSSLKLYTAGAFTLHDITPAGYDFLDGKTVQSARDQIFNFNAPVTGSAIGNSGSITVTNGMSFQDAYDFIQSQDISAEDKSAIKSIVTYIETLAENDIPLKKGFLSKFSDTLSKHHWVPELIAKLIFSYLTGM